MGSAWNDSSFSALGGFSARYSATLRIWYPRDATRIPDTRVVEWELGASLRIEESTPTK